MDMLEKIIEHKVNELANDKPRSSKILNLSHFMPVALDVVFGLENFGVEHDKIHKLVKDSLDIVGLTGLDKREPAADKQFLI